MKDFEKISIDINKGIEEGIKASKKICRNQILIVGYKGLEKYRNIRFDKIKNEQDKIFFENLTGYSFMLMFASIIVAVNPLIIVVPVAFYHTVAAFLYIKNYDWFHSVGKVW